MGQDCNQRVFRTTFAASIARLRTGLSATETAIIQPGPQSVAAGQHYLPLTKSLSGIPPALASRCLGRGYPKWTSGSEPKTCQYRVNHMVF
jgi:hypothetical protein